MGKDRHCKLITFMRYIIYMEVANGISNGCGRLKSMSTILHVLCYMTYVGQSPSTHERCNDYGFSAEFDEIDSVEFRSP